MVSAVKGFYLPYGEGVRVNNCRLYNFLAREHAPCDCINIRGADIASHLQTNEDMNFTLALCLRSMYNTCWGTWAKFRFGAAIPSCSWIQRLPS